jgi:methionyl-tRNA formyltransferase
VTVRAVVFAYSEVGARCLAALYRAGAEVPLVVTHEDDPNETRWFQSVAEIAREHGSRVVTPPDANDPALAAEIASLRPEFLFSFYYRKMLPAAILAIPSRAALNMHGSLLPKYRGRAPVNWAVLHGEIETGASLHHMVAKPDAGALVDQQAVPIGPDDTAFEVAARVADAAVAVLERALPKLAAGTAEAIPLDLARGSYFGGRRPEDGEFLWEWPAKRIHDLVRAVAPPFPGAYGALGSERLDLHRTRLDGALPRFPALAPCLYGDGEHVVAECGDGTRLVLLDAQLDGRPFDTREFNRRFGPGPLPLSDWAATTVPNLTAGRAGSKRLP